ncbi:hypothetical protein BN80_038 [Yersinia phage phiR1-RT]|uniref:Uncharacterized protein n=1 Tax=Yersinia phage phiR1-RT TaxID=1206558 RepID=I7LEI5_BPPR1|nr:spackle periplasmic [Yersinia phage phiR1-RT]CCI88612.1 hypothetical protein BN80_038 [Yersinia phage phiR1-RT]
MKTSILALIFAMTSCSAPAFASHSAPNSGYTSIECIRFIEGTPGADKKLIKDLAKGATTNQKMLLDDLSEKDMVVAGTNLYCENKSVQEVLQWIGL